MTHAQGVCLGRSAPIYNICCCSGNGSGYDFEHFGLECGYRIFLFIFFLVCCGFAFSVASLGQGIKIQQNSSLKYGKDLAELAAHTHIKHSVVSRVSLFVLPRLDSYIFGC